VAVALDGNVVTSPDIQARDPGREPPDHPVAHPAQAVQLQNELKYGSVPLDLKPLFVTSVSAQVARTSWDAGLVAAAIGLLLVVVYAFFYYRGLGSYRSPAWPSRRSSRNLAVVLLSLYRTSPLAGIAG